MATNKATLMWIAEVGFFVMLETHNFNFDGDDSFSSGDDETVTTTSLKEDNSL